MENITRLDIERDGLERAGGLASARTAAEQRAKDYQVHLKRMESDPEYRLRWEQNEREFEEAKKRNFYY